MGLRGPKRKDTAEQARLGDPGHRAKKREAEQKQKATFDLSAPQMPDYLIEEAQEVWAFIVPQLQKHVHALDTDILAQYCQLRGKAIKYERFCTEYGDWVQKSAATKVLRPEIKFIRDLHAEANKVADRLGLNPKAREALGIKIEKPKTADQLAEDKELEFITRKR